MSVLGRLLLGAFLVHSAPPAPAKPAEIASLRTDHPRLLLTTEREAELRALAARDPFLARLLEELRLAADRMLEEPVESYRLVGPRLLTQSRACLAKVSVLSLAARWYDDERYVGRAWRELAAAAAFPDWNPSHFLDTAEMSAAFAIGYDWLHHRWTPEQRALLREAMIEKGLKPGLTEPGERASARENNWNPVTNGGLALAALAVADHAPDLAASTLRRAFANLPLALKYYAPDGAWYEGPGYWKYGTTYAVMLADALHTALGHDGGLSATPGFARTGHFFRDAVGPDGLLFNYADADPRPGSSPALFWLARTFNQPELATFEKRLLERHLSIVPRSSLPPGTEESALQAIKLGDIEAAELVYSNRFFPLEIVWYHPGAESTQPRRSSHYRGVVDVAFLRHEGPGERSLFVGIKGAGVPNAHAHLDAGSFVLDHDGVRWVEDLGMENYDLPGFWERSEGGRRWNYFRTGSLSHNVVTLDGRNQRTPATARLDAFLDAPRRSHARFDLTDAYREQAASVRRGLALIDGLSVLVQDELIGLPNRHAEARWAVLTGASVAIDGRRATLHLGGKTLVAHLISPANARWSTQPANPPTSAEIPNEGKTLLLAQAPLSAGQLTRFAVVFQSSDLPPPDTFEPLSEWPDGR